MDRSAPESDRAVAHWRRLGSWVMLLCLVALLAACWYAYRRQKALVRTRAVEATQSLAYYESTLLRQWYASWGAEARQGAMLPDVQRVALSGVPWDREPASLRQSALAALMDLGRNAGFDGVGLVGADGLYLPDAKAGDPGLFCDDPLRDIVLQAGRPVLSDFHLRGAAHLHLDLVVALSSGARGPGVPVALVFVVDPDHNFFRVLDLEAQSSLLPRTVLIQREGDRAVLVSSRFPERDLPSLPLRALSPESPVVRALEGELVSGEGLDYRGRRVIYATGLTPGLRWGLLCQVRASEAYASMRVTALLVWGIVLLSSVTAGSALHRLWSSHHEKVVGRLATLDMRYQTLVETAQEGILVLDAAGNVSFANNRAAALFGLERDSTEALPCTALLDPSVHGKIPELLKVRPEGGRGEFELPCRRSGEEDLWAIFVVSSLYAATGAHRGTLCLVTDITSRRRNEQERMRLLKTLEDNQVTLKHLVRRLFDTQEIERKRLSHDLHDELAQLLAGAEMHLCAAENRLPGDSGPALQGDLDSARTCLSQANLECRKLIALLRPPVLDEIGLLEALRNLAASMAPPPVAVDFGNEQVLRTLSEETALALYRIAQEALGNVRKHAGASRAELRLWEEKGVVVLQVSDDGAGFTSPPPGRSLHFGMNGMRERAELIGAFFRVTSAPGHGTVVRVEVPGAVAAKGVPETRKGGARP